MWILKSIKKALKKSKRSITKDASKRELIYKFQWKELLQSDSSQWKHFRNSAKNGPKILIATSTGGHFASTSIESLLAIGLTLRGADVHFLLCDRFLPACFHAISTSFSDLTEFANYGPSKSLCDSCFYPGYKLYQPLDLPIHLYSKLVSEKEHLKNCDLAKTIPSDSIANYRDNGVAIGEHALAGALRFYACGSLEGEQYAETILRRYFKAALLAVSSIRRLFNNFNYECVVFNHGIYVPQGLIGEIARQEKIRVVNWVTAYRKKCFIFSHDDTYHHTMMNEPVDRWENLFWGPEIESQLMDYLKSRWHGTQDWIWFHEKPQFDLTNIAYELGIDFSKPCIGMLTNVMWDAQLHYPANAFSNMLEWALKTITYFKERPELQLLIRVHPAEIRGTIPSRQPLVNEIKKVFPVIPKNIFIIPPESQISTYSAMLQCDSVIIYGTKTGVELASMGIPVIVAGEAWIRNKGITHDASSIEEYFRILEQLPLGEKLENETILRARKYAYHFFFRRMIPLQFMEPFKDLYKPRLNNLDELTPGKSEGLDVICNGILNGTDFIYPAESKIAT
jgi:hypothetical protein